MPITQDTAVKFRATPMHELLPNGSALKLLDKGHMAYSDGGYENIFPKGKRLADKNVGDSVTVDLAVEDAFVTDNSLKRTPSPRRLSPA